MGSDCLYNIPSVVLYGAEFEAALRLGKLQATLAYNYQEVNADETPYDENYTYYLPELLPKHKIKALARYEAWKDGFLQLSGRYVSERQAQKGETLDAYFTMDAGLEQHFTLGLFNFTAAFYVSNLLGEEYQEIAGYDMPRQVYGLRLSTKF